MVKGKPTYAETARWVVAKLNASAGGAWTYKYRTAQTFHYSYRFRFSAVCELSVQMKERQAFTNPATKEKWQGVFTKKALVRLEDVSASRIGVTVSKRYYSPPAVWLAFVSPSKRGIVTTQTSKSRDTAHQWKWRQMPWIPWQHPKSFQVAFRDKKLAKRVAKRLAHLARLCGAKR